MLTVSHHGMSFGEPLFFARFDLMKCKNYGILLC